MAQKQNRALVAARDAVKDSEEARVQNPTQKPNRNHLADSPRLVGLRKLYPHLQIQRQRICTGMFVWHLDLRGVEEPKRLGLFDRFADCEREARTNVSEVQHRRCRSLVGFYEKIRHEKALVPQLRLAKRQKIQHGGES